MVATKRCRHRARHPARMHPATPERAATMQTSGADGAFSLCLHPGGERAHAARTNAHCTDRPRPAAKIPLQRPRGGSDRRHAVVLQRWRNGCGRRWKARQSREARNIMKALSKAHASISARVIQMACASPNIPAVMPEPSIRVSTTSNTSGIFRASLECDASQIEPIVRTLSQDVQCAAPEPADAGNAKHQYAQRDLQRRSQQKGRQHQACSEQADEGHDWAE